MPYLLILFAHVGVLGSGNSNSVTTAEMSSKQTCEAAGAAAASMASDTTKVIKFRCVPR